MLTRGETRSAPRKPVSLPVWNCRDCSRAEAVAAWTVFCRPELGFLPRPAAGDLWRPGYPALEMGHDIRLLHHPSGGQASVRREQVGVSSRNSGAAFPQAGPWTSPLRSPGSWLEML